MPQLIKILTHRGLWWLSTSHVNTGESYFFEAAAGFLSLLFGLQINNDDAGSLVAELGGWRVWTQSVCLRRSIRNVIFLPTL